MKEGYNCLLLLNLVARAGCERNTDLWSRGQNHRVSQRHVEVGYGVDRRCIVFSTSDTRDAAHGCVNASVLIKVVVSTEALVARRIRAQEGLVIRVNRADVALEMLTALEALATARHLARVDLAALAEVVHLLRLVGHTTTARSLGDEACVRVGEVSKVIVKAHALGKHGEAKRLSRDVLDLDLARGRRGEDRGNVASHGEGGVRRAAASAVGRRRAGRAVRVKTRIVGGALRENHGTGSSIAEERVAREGMHRHGHGHGHGASVRTSKETKARLASTAPHVTVAVLARRFAVAERREGHLWGHGAGGSRDGVHASGSWEPRGKVVGVGGLCRVVDEVVDAEVDRGEVLLFQRGEPV